MSCSTTPRLRHLRHWFLWSDESAVDLCPDSLDFLLLELELFPLLFDSGCQILHSGLRSSELLLHYRSLCIRPLDCPFDFLGKCSYIIFLAETQN